MSTCSTARRRAGPIRGTPGETTPCTGAASRSVGRWSPPPAAPRRGVHLSGASPCNRPHGRRGGVESWSGREGPRVGSVSSRRGSGRPPRGRFGCRGVHLAGGPSSIRPSGRAAQARAGFGSFGCRSVTGCGGIVGGDGAELVQGGTPGGDAAVRDLRRPGAGPAGTAAPPGRGVGVAVRGAPGSGVPAAAGGTGSRGVADARLERGRVPHPSAVAGAHPVPAGAPAAGAARAARVLHLAAGAGGG